MNRRKPSAYLINSTELKIAELSARACYDSIHGVNFKVNMFFNYDYYCLPELYEDTIVDSSGDTILAGCKINELQHLLVTIDNDLMLEEFGGLPKDADMWIKGDSKAILARFKNSNPKEYDNFLIIMDKIYELEPIDFMGMFDTNINFLRKYGITKGHESILEHVKFTFRLKMPRNVLQQLSRHRVGISPSVKSTRYTINNMINKYKVMNDSVTNYDSFIEYLENNYGIIDKVECDNTSEYIISMLDSLSKRGELIPDMVKDILPEHWWTTGIYTINLRALIHLFELRDSKSAFKPIRDLVREISNVLPDEILTLLERKN